MSGRWTLISGLAALFGVKKLSSTKMLLSVRCAIPSSMPLRSQAASGCALQRSDELYWLYQEIIEPRREAARAVMRA